MSLLKKPCKECPYRKQSLPGYFGGNPPETYLIPLLQDIPVVCHKSMGEDVKSLPCCGWILARLKSGKLARGGRIAYLEAKYKDNPNQAEVLTSWEFVKHHNIERK